MREVVINLLRVANCPFCDIAETVLKQAGLPLKVLVAARSHPGFVLVTAEDGTTQELGEEEMKGFPSIWVEGEPSLAGKMFVGASASDHLLQQLARG